MTAIHQSVVKRRVHLEKYYDSGLHTMMQAWHECHDAGTVINDACPKMYDTDA